MKRSPSGNPETLTVELAGLRTFTILLVIATVLINEDQIVTYFVTYY